MLREYLIAEAMHALGIPTTRALAVVATGDTRSSARSTVAPRVPGAVLTRVASSHLRIGTFEYAAATGSGTPREGWPTTPSHVMHLMAPG